jgi:hypothetical protein
LPESRRNPRTCGKTGKKRVDAAVQPRAPAGNACFEVRLNQLLAEERAANSTPRPKPGTEAPAAIEKGELMPETKTKVSIAGGAPVSGFDVPITETTERWTEVTLEDGAVLRVKPNIVGVVRVEGKYDPEGNPLYALKSQTVMTVSSAPAHLKQGAGSGKAN